PCSRPPVTVASAVYTTFAMLALLRSRLRTRAYAASVGGDVQRHRRGEAHHRDGPDHESGAVARAPGDHPDNGQRHAHHRHEREHGGEDAHSWPSYALREPMSTQYIFTTYKLSRRYPPDREVLTDISLSFMPGAKIGVIGYNGSGKSTLLRIMAGLDT